MKSISYEVKHLFSKRWAKVALVAALLITPAIALSGCGKFGIR
ncbi:MAG: MetQ/NlpA family ABC transporter substrate-binding protein [Acetilactobacillus jinshanensis]